MFNKVVKLYPGWD